MLTMKGKSAAVARHAEAYQCLLDIATRVDVEEGISQGLKDANKGKIRRAKEFFDEFEGEHGN